MATNNNPNQTGIRKQPEYAETQPPRHDLQEQRGGPQSDQRVGETDKGAHNQEAKAETRKVIRPRALKLMRADYEVRIKLEYGKRARMKEEAPLWPSPMPMAESNGRSSSSLFPAQTFAFDDSLIAGDYLLM